MSIISWNCRGLGNQTAVQVLADLVRSKRPSVVYLIKTFVDKQRMETIRVQLGYDNVFTVDADGHSGGLALLWNNIVEFAVTGYSSNHIDTEIRLDVGCPCWRFTGFYGYRERQRRREAWQLLRTLSARSQLPWVVMGDYNDLLDQFEKRGRVPHPGWLINGFREAVADSGLQDVPFGGHQYTWVKSRGTDRMIEEKLDRILANDSWLNLFEGVQALSLTVPYSDHRPLILTPVTLPSVRKRARFCFDNMWLREEACREIVTHSWDRSIGLDTLARVEACAQDISRWGRRYNKDFQRKIELNKRRLDLLSSHRDESGMREYEVVERNLLFLHRKNSFKRLQDEDGNWVVDEAGLDSVMLNYFAVFWDIMGGEVTAFCRRFLETAELPQKANDTFIVLIPKKTVPETMKDLRPIALCNVVYKIAAKVCANWLKPLLQNLISGAQSAFIPGRLITDNIMLAYEVHHHLKKKTQGREGVVALKLDMSKAYDRVEWRFLQAVMIKLGFGVQWVNILLETVTSVRYHILHEQRKVGPVIPGRGLRQGDPLSPYLFLFVAEGLSAMIERRMSPGELHGVTVARGAPSISHLLFADDSFLFHRATVEESVQMRYVLDTYAKASGQYINYDKSAACFSANVPQNIRNDVVDILGVEEGLTSGKYLGLPSLVDRRKKAILGFLKDRILSRVWSWNAKFLSRAGREVLLKNVLQAMPAYAMSVFLLPIGLCREMEVIMNQYWWTGRIGDGRGIRWRSWEGLSRPKANGGMGFRRLHEMNLALLGKQAWRLVTNPTSLLARVFKARYYPSCEYFEAGEGSNPSFVWRGMLEVRSCLKEGCRRAIGDGGETSIGLDPWLPVDDNPYVETDLHPSVRTAPVSSLMNMHVCGGREISGYGNGIRRVLIQLSPVTSISLWWQQMTAHRIRYGTYIFPRSCVQESALHLFVYCAKVAQLWNKLGWPQISDFAGNSISDWFFWAINLLDVDSLPKFLMTCWGVWGSRNDSVWKGVVFYINVVLRRSMVFLDCWRSANEGTPRDQEHLNVVSWSKPAHGRLKLNTDVALRQESNEMGLGWVL
ncbi:PREDICTED: uncharacterized protein LOC109159537 [Ipomoea nil]|uniref:uncharacterized protein LOC109159537 n=1 Tax=Ipomoea nil TaxID=35883 RepID=UPI000900DA5D|nr:PREDICTED: uncharacterized protein LOC109159537 [Ipomoea nil]